MSDIAYPVQGSAPIQLKALQDETPQTLTGAEQSFSPPEDGNLRVLDWDTLSKVLVSSVEALVGDEASDRHKDLVLWLMNLERRLHPYDV